MRKEITNIIVGILWIVVGTFILLCKTPVEEKKRIGVVVTLLPFADFVKHVGDGRVEITVMVPPGATPHTYEPTPEQLRKVSKAKLYVKVGSGVEFELAWLDKIKSLNRKMLIVDGSQGIPLIDKDPHIWLSPLNAKKIVENICQGLIKVDPKNKEFYIKNKERYIKQLEELDEYIRVKIKNINKRGFMVYHPAWGYFAKEYGIEQISIEQKGKEPTAMEIKDAIKKAKKYKIKVIFVSPQFPTKGAEVIAKEIGGEVKFLDPLPSQYIQEIKNSVDKLIQAMR